MPRTPTLAYLARVKLELLRSGLKIPRSLGQVPFFDVIFPKGVWTSLAQADFNRPGARFELIQEQEFHYLASGAERIHVEIRSNPDFYNARTSSGKCFGEIAGLRANYVVIFPDVTAADSEISPEDVLEVVQKSLLQRWAEYVSFSNHDPDVDAALPRMLPYVEAIKRHADTHISLSSTPPKGPELMDQLYAAGVDGMAFQPVGAERGEWDEEMYRAVFERAGEIFAKGGVGELLWLQAGRKPELLTRIAQSLDRGWMPILVYRTAFGEAAEAPMDLAETVMLLRHAAVLAKRKKFRMGWVPHAEAVLQSVDPRFFIRMGSDRMVRSLMRTLAGSRLAIGINAVRRHLRVRER